MYGYVSKERQFAPANSGNARASHDNVGIRSHIPYNCKQNDAEIASMPASASHVVCNTTNKTPARELSPRSAGTFSPARRLYLPISTEHYANRERGAHRHYRGNRIDRLGTGPQAIGARRPCHGTVARC